MSDHNTPPVDDFDEDDDFDILEEFGPQMRRVVFKLAAEEQLRQLSERASLERLGGMALYVGREVAVSPAVDGDLPYGIGGVHLTDALTIVALVGALREEAFEDLLDGMVAVHESDPDDFAAAMEQVLLKALVRQRAIDTNGAAGMEMPNG